MHTTLMTYLTEGGPTLWVLIVCSLALIALCYERYTKLRALDVDHEWLVAQMSMALQQQNLAEATRICQQAPGALARVFESGLYRADHTREEIEAAMATRITQQTQLLDRNMSAIGTMAVVAPFIGLFGTVLGIVRSFQHLTAGNPTAIDAGIAEALASTATGLFVAILAVVFFNYFKNRVRTLTAQIHVASSQLVEMLVLARTGREFPLDLRVQSTGPAPSGLPDSGPAGFGPAGFDRPAAPRYSPGPSSTPDPASAYAPPRGGTYPPPRDASYAPASRDAGYAAPSSRDAGYAAPHGSVPSATSIVNNTFASSSPYAVPAVPTSPGVPTPNGARSSSPVAGFAPSPSGELPQSVSPYAPPGLRGAVPAPVVGAPPESLDRSGPSSRYSPYAPATGMTPPSIEPPPFPPASRRPTPQNGTLG